MLKKNKNRNMVKSFFFFKYCKRFFFFNKSVKFFFKSRKENNIKIKKKKHILRKSRYYKKSFFFFCDLYNIYFFFLWRNRKKQKRFVKLINSKFFLVEIKSSLNNLFINLYVINKGKRKLIYYISSGMKFRNSLKSVNFASIRLSDILIGYVKYKKIKNIIVYIYGLEYKLLKLFKLLGSYKNQKNFNILYFLVKLNFVFNGVRLKRKQRK